jgi:hypothetical protein
MRPSCNQLSQTAAILALAGIKVAVEGFDRGETNVFDALDAIIMEVDTYRAVARTESGLEAA